MGYSALLEVPPIVAPPVPPQPEQGELPTETTPPQATSAAPPTPPTIPPVAPTTSEPSNTISASKFRDLIHTFQTLTTTHAAQQMAEMRAHQDQ